MSKYKKRKYKKLTYSFTQQVFSNLFFLVVWGRDQLIEFHFQLFIANQNRVFKNLTEIVKKSKKANKSRPVKLIMTN